MQRTGVDPFEVNVKASLEVLRNRLPNWKLLEELVADSEALNSLATIIKLQGDWVKHRASSLYIDPILVELKIQSSKPAELARVLWKAWHPIVTLEQLSQRRVRDAMDYWNTLLPLKDRFRDDFEMRPVLTGFIDVNELLKLRILSQNEFEEGLKRMRTELRDTGRVEYWRFIHAETFDETVVRAYLTSFLLTEGFATLELNPLEDEVFVTPCEEYSKGRPRSVALPLSYDEWVKHEPR